MKVQHVRAYLLTIVFLLTSNSVQAEQRFSDLVGQVKIGEVAESNTYQLPFIVWGGDVATFHANGGLKTTPESIYGSMGLNFEMTPGDNFVQQVRDYMAGKTPFLRGTFHMVGLASDVIGSDPRTQGVMLMQMTWSLGDHIVARDSIKTLADLKGTTGCIQICGPHVGLVDDALKTAHLAWDDVKVVWANDLTASDNSPAAIFRKNPEIKWCTVISPDMLGLTGGLQNTGSGAEGTVQGSHVLVSTSELSRSIADVYICRKDFYQKHRELCEKFVAGYLKATEQVVDMVKVYDEKGSQDYERLLRMAQDIYGKQVLPTIEADAHGLMLDCKFVGLPGNVAFFTEENNLNGFERFHENALQLAISRGYAVTKEPILPSELDYQRIAELGGLAKVDVKRTEKFAVEAVQSQIEGFEKGQLDDRTIYAFTIPFEPNQMNFPLRQYSKEFQEIVELCSKYGNAVLVVRGHADPSQTLMALVRAGLKKGILQRSGNQQMGYSYSLNGKAFDIDATNDVVKLIEAGSFDGVDEHNPREIMQGALNLSRQRAVNVRDRVIEYASQHKLVLDASQIQVSGVGIREPFIARPKNIDQARQNMRVEFRLIRVDAEVIKSSDFDF